MGANFLKIVWLGVPKIGVILKLRDGKICSIFFC